LAPFFHVPSSLKHAGLVARRERSIARSRRRGKVFNITHLKRLEEICRDVCCDFEAELKEFDGERDHVHLLVIYPPKVRPSELVNSLKGVSSRLLKVEFPAIPTFWRVRRSQGAL
jgi:putative transposase